MDRTKGDRFNVQRHARTKKRVFHGNRYLSEKKKDFASTSAKKLLASMNMDVPIATSFVYCILDFAGVFSGISANFCK